MAKVRLGERDIRLDETKSLLENLIENRVEVNHSCGGMGSCGTCRVLTASGSFDPRNEVEAELAEMYGYEARERLSCQVRWTGDIEIVIP